jgi:hypothetical protein
MVWVLARKLKARELEGIKEDIITYRELRTLLGYSKTSKHALDLVIKEAVALGVLRRAWKGSYRVIKEGVDYVVTSTIPQSVGKRALHNEYMLKDWLEFIEAEEVEREFRALVAWTRVYGSLYWQVWGLEQPAGNASNTGFTPPTKKSKSARVQVQKQPATLKPPRLRHFIITLLRVGHNLLEAVVLGDAYLLTLGLGGEGSSGQPSATFSCVRCRTPSGGARYLCAGSVKVLQEVLASAGPSPMCSIGGDLAPTSLVADVPPGGLQLFDQAPATAPKIEPGLQVYNTPLYPVVQRWYQLAVTSTYRNSIGVPALVLLPRSKVNRAVSRRPLRLLREVLFILDALGGAVHTALSQLPIVDSLSLRNLPSALLRGIAPRLPLTDGGGGGVTIYVEYQLKERVREVDRAGRQRVYWLHRSERLAPLSEFLRELDSYAGRGIEVQIMNFKVIVPLVGADATGLSDALNFGYLYIYHNENKDPPGAVRFEFRPHSDIKKTVGKYGLLNLFVRSLATLLPTLEATRMALAP